MIAPARDGRHKSAKDHACRSPVSRISKAWSFSRRRLGEDLVQVWSPDREFTEAGKRRLLAQELFVTRVVLRSDRC